MLLMLAVIGHVAVLNGDIQGMSIGRCSFKGDRPSSATLIRGNVNIIGNVRQTGTRGGVNLWKGDGDVWVIYKSASEMGKHEFDVSEKVQSCRDF